MEIDDQTVYKPSRRPRVFRPMAALGAIFIISAAALAVNTPSSADAADQPGIGVAQEIRNKQNTLCLDNFQWENRPGAEVRQWTCAETNNQLWSVNDRGGNGFVEIKNKHSDLCLDNFNAATAPGSEVRQWSCWGGEVQQWKLTDLGWGWTEIRNRVSDLCLTSDAEPLDGSSLSQERCDSSSVQRWAITDPTVSKLTYTLNRSAQPTADEADAYGRIADAMDQAVARYNRYNNTERHLIVSYVPGVPTADANNGGYIRFGSDRQYMREGVALHEISHTVGVGTSYWFPGKCEAQDWPTALPLLRSWDGPDARINCGGSHMWPYGINFPDEYSDLAFERHLRLVQGMRHDGL